MILVAGGSGFIGSAVVRRLRAAGQDVSVMTAHPRGSRRRIEGMGAIVVPGDIQDPPSLGRAVRGASTVIQAITFPTFPLEKPRRGYTFEEYDHRGTERLVQASVAAGVERFVFASGVGAAADAPKIRHRAKWGGEEAIRATGISHAIIRPTWVYGPEDQALNRFVWFARHLPFVPVIGDGSQRMQPVFIDDVAEVMARAADTNGPVGTFELGGPEVMTMNEVLATMTDVMRRRRPLVHFPPVLPWLAGFFLQVVPKQPLSPAAVDFVLDDAVGDTGSLLASFEVRLTALRAGLETYLGA